jgi:hypothetical protein
MSPFFFLLLFLFDEEEAKDLFRKKWLDSEPSQIGPNDCVFLDDDDDDDFGRFLVFLLGDDALLLLLSLPSPPAVFRLFVGGSWMGVVTMGSLSFRFPWRGRPLSMVVVSAAASNFVGVTTMDGDDDDDDARSLVAAPSVTTEPSLLLPWLLAG